MPLHDPPVAALAVGGTVWIASWAPHPHERRRPHGKGRSVPFGLPCRPFALAYGDGRIWIASSDRSCSLTAVDPRSGVQWWKPLHQPGLGVFRSQGWGADGIAFASNSVWVTVGPVGLVRVSPERPCRAQLRCRPRADGRSSPTTGRYGPAILGPDTARRDRSEQQLDRAACHRRNHAGLRLDLLDPFPAPSRRRDNTVWAPAAGEGQSRPRPGSGASTRYGIGFPGSNSCGGKPCGVSLGHGKVWVANPSDYEVDEISPSPASSSTGFLSTRRPTRSPPLPPRVGGHGLTARRSLASRQIGASNKASHLLRSGSIGSSGSSFAFSSSSCALSRSCFSPVGTNGHHVPVLKP